MTRPGDRCLIVNADDFGLSEGTNRGIVRAHEQGIVTGASLMVRPATAADAARYARRSRTLDVGLHLDLGEWAYRDGEWLAVYEVAPLDDAAAVAAEVRRQLGVFRDLVGRDPTHLDSHQHAHRSGPLLDAAARLSAELGVPLRHAGVRVNYRGDFYGQTGKGLPLPEAITPEAIAEVIRSLGAGVTELACHPGDDADLSSTYRLERLTELGTLCDPHLRDLLALEGVRLIRFTDLRSDAPGPSGKVEEEGQERRV